MKTAIRIVAVAGVLGIGLSVSGAATVRAASGGQPDVQTALDAARDGDTVVIPAGTFTWTQPVSLKSAKAITIQGAGIDRTIVVDKVPRPGNAVLRLALAAGKRFRLTGMTFRGSPEITKQLEATVSLAGDARDFRVDHLKFVKPGARALRCYGANLYGVVDHCFFDLSNFRQGLLIWHQAWNGGNFGDGSFADDLCLGTEKAVYIEDCTFIGAGVAGAGACDSFAGGRFVFRYNTVTNQNLAVHGTESGGRWRSVRSYEIYNNTFTSSTCLFCGILLRGGTGVIFNNRFRGAGGSTGYKAAVLMANYRSDKEYAPWGKATGASVWDGNQQPDGYPCLDQVGRGTCDLLSGYKPAPVGWPHQASEPVYVWNSDWRSVPGYPSTKVASQNSVIKINRDYYVDVPKPGYAPYTYPHPLTRPAHPPATPTDLRTK
ncbi:MAG: hypothetical protein JXR37_27700 [Kiritimatiellae bacterium]|nr:hypothetical protein [Kiritimatiellia bacterium]